MGGNPESLEGGPNPVNEPETSLWVPLLQVAASVAAGGKAPENLNALAGALLSAGAGQVFVLLREKKGSPPVEETPNWTTVVAAGVDDVLDRPRTFAYARRLAGWVERTGKPLSISNVPQDPRFPHPPEDAVSARVLPLSPSVAGDACLILTHPTSVGVLPELAAGAAALAGWILEREKRKERERSLQKRLLELEREVVRLERRAAVGEVAEEMNRELAAPLVGMGRLADEVIQTFEEGDTRREMLETIVEEASRLLRILTDHQEMTRSAEPELQVEDLNRLAAEALGLMNQEFMNRHVSVTRRLGSDLPPLLLDPNLMRRVFLNILRSALESAAPGGRVKLETKRRGDRVEILVAADGKRSAGDSISRLWDPFQGETDRSEDLSPVSIQRILRDHRGVLRTAATPDWPLVYSLVLPISGNRERRRSAGDRRRA